MCVKRSVQAENQYSGEVETFHFSIGRWISLRLGYAVPLDKRTYNGWTGYLQFYLFRCWYCHKLHVDYLHGLNEDSFDCRKHMLDVRKSYAESERIA